jgi:uncharacterized damage-inducible protein DinB
MRIQDYVIDNARTAGQEAFRYAAAVPADKLSWSPDGARSVLGMCQELAVCPTWAIDTIVEEEPDYNEEAMTAQRVMLASWDTVETCRSQFEERFEKWADLVAAMRDEQLAKTKWLRYDGGRDFTYLEMLDYVRWNSTYHLGQIAYIQTLYGDKEMY